MVIKTWGASVALSAMFGARQHMWITNLTVEFIGIGIKWNIFLFTIFFELNGGVWGVNMSGYISIIAGAQCKDRVRSGQNHNQDVVVGQADHIN